MIQFDAVLFESQSDWRGIALLSRPLVNRLVVVARKVGFAQRVEGVGDSDEVEIVLRRSEELTVTVLDQRGDPVANAEVWQLPIVGNFVADHAQTGLSGRAALAWDGRSELLVTAPGYCSERVSVESTVVEASAIEVVLSPGREVSGTLTTSAGGPISGGRVDLRGSPGGGASQLSAPNGSFAFDGLPATVTWDWIVTASHPGFETNSAFVSPGQRGVRIALYPEAILSVTVLHPDGSPATDVRVDGAWRSDPSGVFLIDTARGRQTIISVAARSNADPRVLLEATAHVQIPDHSVVHDATVVLGEAAERSYVAVRVSGPLGRPGAGARVALIARGWIVARARCDDDGTALLEVPAQPGTTAFLTADGQGPNGSSSTTTLTSVQTQGAPPLEVVDVLLAEPRTVSLYGLMRTGEEKLISPGWVIPIDEPDVSVQFTGDGQLVLPATGRVLALVRTPENSVGLLDLRPPHGREGLRRIELVPPAIATGRVLMTDVGIDDVAMGSSLVVGVFVRTHGGEWWSEYAPLDDSGRYKFVGLPAGRALVRAFLTDNVKTLAAWNGSQGLLADWGNTPLASAAIDLQSGGRAHAPVLRVGRARALAGHVLDTAGVPISGALVSAFDPGDWLLGPVTTTDADGRFAMNLDCDARVRLRTDCDGYATSFVAVERERASEVRITLTRESVISVTCSAAARLPGPWSLEVRDSRTGVTWRPLITDEQVDAATLEYSCVLRGLPETELDVVLHSCGIERVQRILTRIGRSPPCRFER